MTPSSTPLPSRTDKQGRPPTRAAAVRVTSRAASCCRPRLQLRKNSGAGGAPAATPASGEVTSSAPCRHRAPAGSRAAPDTATHGAGPQRAKQTPYTIGIRAVAAAVRASRRVPLKQRSAAGRQRARGVCPGQAGPTRAAARPGSVNSAPEQYIIRRRVPEKWRVSTVFGARLSDLRSVCSVWAASWGSRRAARRKQSPGAATAWRAAVTRRPSSLRPAPGRAGPSWDEPRLPPLALVNSAEHRHQSSVDMRQVSKPYDA